MNYEQLTERVVDGLRKMKYVSDEEFEKKINHFKNYNYKNFDNKEIFWKLTQVMFFNMGKKASMIENKIPILKENLYDYEKLINFNDEQINAIILRTGFPKQIEWIKRNAVVFNNITKKYGSFQNFIYQVYNINDIYCSNKQLEYLYCDLKKLFIGIGETAGWHFLTDLGFNSLKPDTVIRRIFYRLGLIEEENDLNKTIEIGREISKQLNLPIRYIDIIFVKYGQVGKSDVLGTIDGICTENNPKCNLCTIKSFCKFKNCKENNYMKEERKIDFLKAIETKTILKDMATTSGAIYKIKEKIKFKERFDNASKELQDLFIEFVNKLDESGIKNYATNTPDYRLEQERVFAIANFFPSKNAIKIAIKYTGLDLKSNILNLQRKSIPSQTSGVYKDFFEVFMKTKTELDEVVKILNIVKNNS
ncbi:MAG: hypothetical protein N2448_00450 [Caloramator sp.]|nr:hypothetical protein [Caloramator sp.]